MARPGARPDDWKAAPMPAATATLAYTREFTADQLARLRRGLVPESMEDRWFIVWHSDALWFHRSWTGQCVYRLRFAARGDRFAVVEARVQRDTSQTEGRDADDLRLLDDLVRLVLELPDAPPTVHTPGSLLRALLSAWFRR